MWTISDSPLPTAKTFLTSDLLDRSQRSLTGLVSIHEL
jgi:hypothetical protein